MTQTQEKRFRKALLSKREELKQQLARRRDGLILMPASDPLERVRNIADRDLNVRYADRIYLTLSLVEGALKEIDDGTFGLCAQCGDEIPMKRLEAVPWSPYCVSCQECFELAEQAEERKGPYAVAS
jgi:DnaK suppressor protein